ncbi:carbohydrate ABC transporter permease [Vallitalea pronyensis]|uniref:Carbohydrate ABC transporter permease n=1 Tax=Vallitalea pronyensis TaxID=1348613 RepID=A0A8J8MIN7_9FIRM|nr:carbohydrate ABC transporter permease [Vallitalea pronyensis]QUI21993.1 carbohydrate ABC transporter permease [Vallitalea pronyensis]
MNKKLVNKIVLIVILALVSLVYIIPILLMVLGSFKTQGEALLFDLSLPKEWLISNYAYVFKTGNILRGYINSIITTGGAVIITLIVGSFAGIIISRRKDWKGNALYYFFVFGLTMTLQTVTTFALLKVLKLYGTYIGVILIFVAVRLPFTIMTFASFVKGVPKEIDEAAIVDGCGPIRLVIHILLPILKPIMITNLIITTISVWNNFIIPLYYFGTSSKWTVPLTVYGFFGMYSRNWHYVFAALVLTVIPIVTLYLLLQKHIVEGMTSGAVKG